MYLEHKRSISTHAGIGEHCLRLVAHTFQLPPQQLNNSVVLKPRNNSANIVWNSPACVLKLSL